MSNHSSQIIINADDFGYCVERNKGIVECFQRGCVSSASLLVTSSGVKQAIQLAKEHHIPLGLHLNLTEGKPICSKLKTLVDSNGEMKGKFGFRDALKANAIDLAEVTQEFNAQLEFFQVHVGHLPTHIDGHQHVHILPQIVPTLSQVFVQFGINRTRIPNEPNLALATWLPEPLLNFYKTVNVQAIEARRVYLASGIISTKAFMGLSTTGKYGTLDRIKLELETMKKCNTVEWMVHPGYSQKHNGDEFSQSPEREFEKELLTNQSLIDFMHQNFKLISFKDLSY